MHELSIGRAMLEQATSIMLQQRATAVTTITLQIGPLSGVEPALLVTAYEQLRIDTVAENANLIIHAMPVRIWCEFCQSSPDVVPAGRLACPRCGNMRTMLIGGDEMLLEAVDLTF